MDFIEALVALALTVFIFVALGQLFSISKSLKRLIALAERPPVASATSSNLEPTSLAEMSDKELLAIWNSSIASPSHLRAEAEQELRARGCYMG